MDQLENGKKTKGDLSQLSKERETKAEDLILREINRAYRPPKVKKPGPTLQELERRKKQSKKVKAFHNNKQKELRQQRLRDGLCTKCGEGPPVKGGRMCEKCRRKGRKVNKWMTEPVSIGY